MHRFEPAAFDLPTEPTAACALADPAMTRALGQRVASALQDLGGGFVGLVGELGAGKTTFTQGLVEALGGEASSPTYTLLNEYQLTPPIYHFDLYRLDSVGELETTAYWDYAEDSHAIVLVEWIDRIPQAWFGQGAIIALDHDDGARKAAVWAADRPELWRVIFESVTDDLA